MAGEKRRRELMQLLQQRGGLSARELCAHFQVSRMTIHRDLKILEQAEKIVRLHGGVASVRGTDAETCCVCQRNLVPHQRGRLRLEQRDSFCCCSYCALSRLMEYPQGRLWVSDFMAGQLLPATQAYYLLNSMVVPCCRPSILSFAAEADILNFRSGFGGAIARLDQALDFLQLERKLKHQ